MCALRGARIGMVFQEPMTALNPLHTIGRQIAEPLRLHKGVGAAAARAEALRLLRARAAARRRASGSTPIRTSCRAASASVWCIAIALACGPDLLIADEPTTALDVTIQREVLELIAELVAEDGMGLLLISHDLGVMAETVQRLLVMYGGTRRRKRPDRRASSRTCAHPYTRGLFARAAAAGPGARHAAGDDPRARARAGRHAGRLPVRRPLRAGSSTTAARALPRAAAGRPGARARCIRLDAVRAHAA